MKRGSDQQQGKRSCTRDSDTAEVHPVICSGDFGRIVELKTHRKLSNHEKYVSLKQHFIPIASYKFPSRIINDQQRCFQSTWLTKYNGLVYSETENGGYCKFCVLFGQCEASVKEFGVLVTKPFTNFKKASEKLGEHFLNTSKSDSSKGRRSHHSAVQQAMAFVTMMEHQEQRIDYVLSSERSKRIAENQLKLRSIAETVIFCGQQGIALRGHCDDRPAVLSNPHDNHGNFLALLQFRVQAGDEVLKKHIESAAGDIVRNKLLGQIRKAGFFSVIADEATDTANDEQFSISIRFFNDGAPSEKFLAFHECDTGVSGEAIADNILSKLTDWQLEPQLLRGQAYDGARAMAGKNKGVAARISAKYPNALYTHCVSHRLNLCVMKCCSIREVNNMMQTSDTMSRFFSNSPKRQLALEQWISDILPEEKRKKMKEMCRTRWVERHEAFEVFLDLFMPTITCLEAIARSRPAEWNRDTRSDAHSLFLALSQFSFVVALVLTQKVLAYTKGLSVKLQGRYVDVVCAHRDIESVKSSLERNRSEIDVFHDRVYDAVLVLAQSVGIDESSPRISSRQQHRQNVPAENTKEYYKRTLTIPILDHLISELDERFDADSSLVVVEFMELLPSTIIGHDQSHLQLSKLTNLVSCYENDLPSSRALDTELDMCERIK